MGLYHLCAYVVKIGAMMIRTEAKPQPTEPFLTDEQSTHVLKIVRDQAKQSKLSDEDAEDCAMSFLLHLFIYLEAHPSLSSQSKLSEPWLDRCADNWVINAFLRESRKRYHEISFTFENFFAEDEDDQLTIEIASEKLSPEESVMRIELVQRILSTVSTLTPAQQELFKRHFLNSEEVKELASESHSHLNAIYQAIWALRKRLRSLLVHQGLSVQEALDYVHTPLYCKKEKH